MRLSSKINSKHLGLFIVFLFLIILPFKDFISYIFITFSRNLLVDKARFERVMAIQQEENLELLFDLRQTEQLKKENETLRKALDFKKRSSLDFLGAEILAFDPSDWRRIITVNVGISDGVYKGMYAIDENGWLVGKVVEVWNNYATVMFVNDPDFSAPVFIGDNAFGLLSGGLDKIRIRYVDDSDNIKTGDKVWVRIPASMVPIYIGEVSKVNKDENDLFLDVQVTVFSEDSFNGRIFIVKR
ncbi:MAG: rod shape-determining protein MreC [Candidatus Omnitrophica bacterium]|nr:rod shape-determining protein MreC [Candidatus Omnitrophota bacterium]